MKRLICLFAFVFCVISFHLPAEDEFDIEEHLLQKAIQYNDSDLYDIIQKYGLYPYGNPILNKAMEADDYLAVKILLEYGADINGRHYEDILDAKGNKVTTGFGKTVLEIAIVKNDLSLVEYFLLKQANPLNKRKTTETIYAFPQKDEISYYTTTAVYEAIKLGRLDIIVLFKQYGADLNEICYEKDYTRGNRNYHEQLSPIQAAAQFGKKDIVMFLISQKVKI